MTELLEYFISEFKKLKSVRGNVFENFIIFVNLLLTDKKDDKYKVGKMKILNYITANKQSIKMKLIQN
tara:strand:- start:2868 stop:3071 length:204 start_codon:yes stop_codon:yes gene_type:complete